MEPRQARSILAVAGIDEAGRGCLAGPVVAAAVILPFNIPGLADSKKLSPARREKLAAQIRKQAVRWSIGSIWPDEIDRINILNASLAAMAKAVSGLKAAPALLLIDGNQLIPERYLKPAYPHGLPEQRSFIKGDANIYSISAASILAKTWRDSLMRKLAKSWPGYGFEKHKGYPVPAHYAALRRLGPCPMHRLTFRGVTAEPLLHELTR